MRVLLASIELCVRLQTTCERSLKADEASQPSPAFSRELGPSVAEAKAAAIRVWRCCFREENVKTFP